MPEQIYYRKELIDMLQKQFDSLSPEFWHHISRPYCPICLEERGRAFIAAHSKENNASS